MSIRKYKVCEYHFVKNIKKTINHFKTESVLKHLYV